MKLKYFLIGVITFLLFAGVAFACIPALPEATPLFVPTETPPSPSEIPSIEVVPESPALPAQEETHGDGLSSCPECTKAHNDSSPMTPSAPPSTGRG
jgi:hypothetical protein